MRTSIWRGSISFGLINIPVTVQSAEQDKDLHFHMLDERNYARIRYNRVNEKTGKPIPNEKIVKGYEYEKNKYIIMSDEDFKRANPRATQTIDISDFVMVEDIDPQYFEKPYYLVPEKGGEKAYNLLQQSLLKSKKVAIATVVMHTKEHLVAIMPRGKYLVLEQLRFPHNIKNPKELEYFKNAGQFKAKPQELRMAERLILDMTTDWNPKKYKDTYYDDLKAHIEKRIKTGQIHEIEETEEDTATESLPAATKTTDLMALLKKSLGEGESGGKKKKSKALPHPAARKKKVSSSHRHIH